MKTYQELSPIQTDNVIAVVKSTCDFESYLKSKPGDVICGDPGDFVVFGNSKFSYDHYAGAISEDS